MTERDVAHFIQITDLLKNPIIEQENTPSAIAVNGTHANRIRLLGVVVSQDPIIIDDGTGSVSVRNFDYNFEVQIGDFVQCIGRPRRHNNEPYVLGEIIKKTNPLWTKYFKTTNKKPKSPLEIIRELDTGDGANFEDAAKKIGVRGEDIITSLLAKGEIFETRPGKLKILE